MKASFFAIAFLMLLNACSPKIRSTVINKQPALVDSTFVLVLQKEDAFINDGVEVGSIKSGDNGMSAACGYYDVIGKLKQLARANGANVIKITQHKVPDQWSTCDRIAAKIFRVPNFRVHEKEIEWSEDRKLTWEDFKGTPKPSLYPNAAAITYCGFGVRWAQVTIFSQPKVFTVNTFTTHLSWVLPGQTDRADLLKHEQRHFDLSEIYSRKLRERMGKLAGTNINADANSLFKTVYAEYLGRQELYEDETQHGLNPVKQHEWERVIDMELWSLRRFIK